LRLDRDLGLQDELVGDILEGQRLGLGLVGRLGQLGAVDAHRASLEITAVEDERLGDFAVHEVAADRELGADERLLLTELEVELDVVDPEVGLAVVLAELALRCVGLKVAA
jgi:hypothetical protein